MQTCFVHFDSWAGRTKAKAEYLGKSKAPGHCKVRLLEKAFVKHPAGKTLYPPEWAVTFDENEKE